MEGKNVVAKILRTVTVPPVLVTGLLVTLAVMRDDIFLNRHHMLISIFLLGIVPLLAYPLQPILPGLRRKGREGQRALAFVMSLIGYTAAVITGYWIRVSENLQFIFNTYFLSSVLLTVTNAVFHLRASGHACGTAGPLIFLLFFIGWWGVLPCAAIGLAVVWSSLHLKRHTVGELLAGAGVCLVSFGCAWLITGLG